jgi:hypothetical protein
MAPSDRGQTGQKVGIDSKSVGMEQGNDELVISQIKKYAKNHQQL